MWSCPMCSKKQKKGYQCASCGFDERGDFVHYRTICCVSVKDVENRRKYSSSKIVVKNDPLGQYMQGSKNISIPTEKQYDSVLDGSGKHVTVFVPSNIEETKEPVALDRKIISKIVFFIPVIILLVGILVYFLIIPEIYGNIISFIDWLFTDTQDIINTLRIPDAILPKVHSIIGLRIFWYVWLAGFIASLFFVGRQLHIKPEPDTANAILFGREPYFMIRDVINVLKQIKQKKDMKELDSLIYNMKRLEEKLSVESAFGYGSNDVIKCENNIAMQLQFLTDTVEKLELGNFRENISRLNISVTSIFSLLHRRMELKRR